MRDNPGFARSTTVFASLQAMWMSSERTKRGDWLGLWHAPQRSSLCRLSHKLILNACTSAVAGGGPLYAAAATGPVVTGVSTVGAPPLQPASRASPATARAETRNETVEVMRFMAYSPLQYTAVSANTCRRL